MTLGTQLVTEILEVLQSNDITDRRFRRLLCETGNTGRKAWRFVNEDTKSLIEEITKKHDYGSNYNVSSRTFSMLFETLSDLKQDRLIRLVHTYGDNNAKKSIRYCKPQTLAYIRKALSRESP